MTVTMVDCIAADIPAVKASIYANAPAAGYVTGGWPIEWSEADFARFARKIRIWQQRYQPGAAAIARVIDREPLAAEPEDVPPFIEERISLGHKDATAYSNISDLPGMLLDIQHAGLWDNPDWRLWVAWYWGRGYPPTAVQVIAEIKRLTGIDVPPSRLWACQWFAGSQWDLSVVYGAQDFSRH